MKAYDRYGRSLVDRRCAVTAEEKIKEAEYFLNRLPSLQVDVVGYEASAFLSASRSVLYHLLDDYAKKFSLGEIPTLHERTFEAAANRQNNQKALEFIAWYRGALDVLQGNSDCGFLAHLRDLSVHRENPRVAYRLESRNIQNQPIPAGATVAFPLVPPPLPHPVRMTVPIRKGSDVIGTLEIEQSAIPFFTEHPEFELMKACATFLEQIKEIVADAHRRFD